MKDYIAASATIEKKIDELLIKAKQDSAEASDEPQSAADQEQIAALKEAYGLQSAKRMAKGAQERMLRESMDENLERSGRRRRRDQREDKSRDKSSQSKARFKAYFNNYLDKSNSRSRKSPSPGKNVVTPSVGNTP